MIVSTSLLAEHLRRAPEAQRRASVDRLARRLGVYDASKSDSEAIVAVANEIRRLAIIDAMRAARGAA